MTKCKLKVGTVAVHRTKDEASPAVQKTRQMAAFPAGYTVMCECQASEGKVQPEDCSGLCVYDANGDEVAQFKGRQFRATQNPDGSISMYAMPGATHDRNRLCRDHSERLATLNARNSEFWRRLDAEG